MKCEFKYQELQMFLKWLKCKCVFLNLVNLLILNFLKSPTAFFKLFICPYTWFIAQDNIKEKWTVTLLDLNRNFDGLADVFIQNVHICKSFYPLDVVGRATEIQNINWLKI